ncbi:MAG: hydrolase, partial [Cyclobacteriaceae bacterium]|nr:hydrolase [Cyclobacteriaceae bacterium]
MRVQISLVFLGIVFLFATKQETYSQQVNAFAFKVKEPIVLDGILDEKIWTSEEGWNVNFTQYFPYDTSAAAAQSRVKIAFDENNLYLAA